MYVADRDSWERLQEVARERRNTRARTRLQAIVLAEQGDIAERIGHSLGCSRRASWEFDLRCAPISNNGRSRFGANGCARRPQGRWAPRLCMNMGRR